MRRMTVAWLSAALAACSGETLEPSDQDAGAAGNGNPLAAALANRSFILQSAQAYEPVPDTVVRVGFGEDSITFSAGCNTHRGDYRLEGVELQVSDVGSTLLGCEPDLTAQDNWIRSFFLESPHVQLDGSELTLRTDGETLLFLDGE